MCKVPMKRGLLKMCENITYERLAVNVWLRIFKEVLTFLRACCISASLIAIPYSRTPFYKGLVIVLWNCLLFVS